jgi:CRP-like cAMP-binding protein
MLRRGTNLVCQKRVTQLMDLGEQMELNEAIRSSYLAQGLTDPQLESLYALAQSKCFDAGEEIIPQFDDSRDLMILASGVAHITTVVGEPIGLIKPGMPMGEISFLDGKPRSGTVVAKEKCDVVVFSAEPLLQLLAGSPDMTARCLKNISRVLCARLRTANQNLAALMALDESEIGSLKH